MAVKTFKVGAEYCVHEVDASGNKTGSSKGGHGTRGEANTQARRINASMNEIVDFIMGDGILITETEAHEDTAAKVREAFRRMVDGSVRFSEMPYWDRPSVIKTYDDMVVVEMAGKMFKVLYTRDGEDNFVFAVEDDWQLGDFEFIPRAEATETSEALFTPATVNALPDKSFAIVLKNGDESSRFLPFRNSQGVVHVPQLLESIRTVPTLVGLKPRVLTEAMATLSKEATQLGLNPPPSDYYPGQPEFQILAETHDSGGTALAEGELEFQLMEPGFGNPRDNNYYPRSMLRRDSAKFKGIQMHEVQHNDNMRTTRTWVATITEAGDRFSESGAPICKAYIHDETFRERCKNLSAGGLLSELQNSIVARGVTVKGKIGDKLANIVQEITAPKYVDFVTQAGAGGHALALYTEAIALDLALVTVPLLKEQRPDLVYHLQMEARSSVLNEARSGISASETPNASLGNNQLNTDVDITEVNMTDPKGNKQLQELQVHTEKLEKEVQEARRASALALIVEKMPYKDLRPRYEKEVKDLKEIEEGYLASLLVCLDRDREFWAKSLKEGNVTGLGASTDDKDPNTKGLSEKEIAERWKEHDRVYGPTA